MLDSNTLAPEKQVAAAVKVAKKFENDLGAIKKEYQSLVTGAIKRNDERIISRLREKILKFFNR